MVSYGCQGTNGVGLQVLKVTEEGDRCSPRASQQWVGGAAVGIRIDSRFRHASPKQKGIDSGGPYTPPLELNIIFEGGVKYHPLRLPNIFRLGTGLREIRSDWHPRSPERGIVSHHLIPSRTQAESAQRDHSAFLSYQVRSKTCWIIHPQPPLHPPSSFARPPAAQALNAAFARAASDDTPTVRSARGQAEDFLGGEDGMEGWRDGLGPVQPGHELTVRVWHV